MKIVSFILLLILVSGCQINNSDSDDNNTNLPEFEEKVVVEEDVVEDGDSVSPDDNTSVENVYKDYSQNDANTPPPPPPTI